MDQNKLIHDLVKDLKPVTVIKFNWVTYLKFIGTAVLCILAMFAISGLRFDLEDIMLTPRFIAESLALLILAIASATSAFHLSIPGEEKKWTLKLPLAVLLMWLLFLVYLFLRENQPVAGWGFSCASESILLSLVPATLLFAFVQKAAPLKIGWTMVFIVLAGGGFGLLGTQLTCSNSDPLHVIVWHAIPVLGLASAASLLSRKLFTHR